MRGKERQRDRFKNSLGSQTYLVSSYSEYKSGNSDNRYMRLSLFKHDLSQICTFRLKNKPSASKPRKIFSPFSFFSSPPSKLCKDAPRFHHLLLLWINELTQAVTFDFVTERRETEVQQRYNNIQNKNIYLYTVLPMKRGPCGRRTEGLENRVFCFALNISPQMQITSHHHRLNTADNILNDFLSSLHLSSYVTSAEWESSWLADCWKLKRDATRGRCVRRASCKVWQDSLIYIYVFIYNNFIFFTIYKASTYSTSTNLPGSAGGPTDTEWGDQQTWRKVGHPGQMGSSNGTQQNPKNNSMRCFKN